MDVKPKYKPPPRDKIFWLTLGLYLFNLFVFLSGIVCMAMSAWILATTAYLTALIKIDELENISLLQQSAFVLLFSGMVLFIVAVFGISAVYTEQCIMIRVYTGALGFIVILELTIAIVITIFRAKIQRKLKFSLYRSLSEEYNGMFNTTSRFTLSLDWAMITYECCGIDDYNDFQTTATHWKQLQEKKSLVPIVPDTCCKYVDKAYYPTQSDQLVMSDRRCPFYPTEENSWRSKGCYDALKEVAYYYITIIIVLGSTLLAVQIIGVIFSLILVSFLKQRQQLFQDIASGKQSLGLDTDRLHKELQSVKRASVKAPKTKT